MRLCLIIILAWFYIGVMGQTDSLIREIETITIKEKRLEIGYSNASRTIQIVSKEDIQMAPVQSIAELLQYVAGVDVRRRGIHGVQADLSIRGGTFDQTLLLINGVSMADPQTGHHLMNIPVDLESIERIEILKGPAARRYGQNAYSGAINIVTSVDDKLTFGVFSDYSSFNSGRIGVNAHLPMDGIKHHISYSNSFSEGYRHNTDYNMQQFYYRSEIEAGEDVISVQAGYSDRAFGANGFYASPQFTEQYEEIQTSLMSVSYATRKGDLQWNPTLYWRRNQDEYIFVRNNPSIYRNLHVGNTFGLELNGSLIKSNGALGFGVEIRHDDLSSNNLGDRFRTTLGFNAEYRMILMGGKLDITPGAGLYSYSDFGIQAFPGIDVGWSFSGKMKAFANIGSTWRVPTFTDLYYEDPANRGNPELLPERALTSELGLKYTSKKVDAQVALFNRSSNNLIDWSKDMPSDPWFPSNIGQITVRGLETTTVFDLSSIFSSSKGAFLQVGYSYLEGENIVDAPLSRYALDLLSHQLNLGIRYSLGERWHHAVYFRYLDRTNLDNYSLWDSRLQYSAGLWQVSVFVNNISNSNYTETNLVPMPGRWFGVSVAYKAITK